MDRFKLEGDEQGWLQLDVDSGELKTKAALDREKVEELTIKIIAYETGENPIHFITYYRKCQYSVM